MSGRNYFFPATNPYTARPPTLEDLVSWIDTPPQTDIETDNRLERWINNSPWTRNNLKAALDYTIGQFRREQSWYEEWIERAEEECPKGPINIRKHVSQWAPFVDGTVMIESRVRNMIAVCESDDNDEEEEGSFVDDDEIRRMIVKCAKARWMVRKGRKGLEREIALAKARAEKAAELETYTSSSFATEDAIQPDTAADDVGSTPHEEQGQLVQTAPTTQEEELLLAALLGAPEMRDSLIANNNERLSSHDAIDDQTNEYVTLHQEQDASSTCEETWMLASDLDAPYAMDSMSSSESEQRPESGVADARVSSYSDLREQQTSSSTHEEQPSTPPATGITREVETSSSSESEGSSDSEAAGGETSRRPSTRRKGRGKFMI